MKGVTRGIYLLFGVLAIGAGVVALLNPSLALPPGVSSALTAHLIREEAAAFVFIGLMFVWCLTHFEQRRPVHFALLVFTALFSLIHWADYLRDYRSIAGAVVNTLPVAIMAATAPFSTPAATGASGDAGIAGRRRTAAMSAAPE